MATSFIPNLYCHLAEEKEKQKDTWQEIPTLNKIWIDALSSPLMSMQVLSLLTLQLPIPLFSFRRALRGGQHGMKLLLHRACVGLAFETPGSC